MMNLRAFRYIEKEDGEMIENRLLFILCIEIEFEIVPERRVSF